MLLKMREMGISKVVFLRKLLLLLCLFSSTAMFSQKENTRWYFGQSGGTSSLGLNFNSGSPVTDNGVTARNFYESASTMSDPTTGDLLFYTDGIYIYDKGHNIMSGQGTCLQGTRDGAACASSASAVQGVQSFKKPGSASIYYVFTVQDVGMNANGFRWHEVDMSQVGNGAIGNPYGVVTSVDNLIATDVCEMIAVTGDCNKVWVVAHKGNSQDFLVVPVTSAGVGALSTQTIATPNDWNTGILGSGTSGRRGSMNFNDQGTKLAMTALWPTGSFWFNFDKTTGTISTNAHNGSKIEDGVGAQFNSYACIWSPDGEKVYFSDYNNRQVYYYNTTTNGPLTQISDVAADYADMAMGYDGKIYISVVGGSQLATISSPNSNTASTVGVGFARNGFNMGSAGLTYGLPQCWTCGGALPCGDTTLAASIPNVCTSNGTFDLDTYNGTSDAGTWTITGGPGGYTASISAGHTFNISNTAGGTYTVRHTLTTVNPGCPSYAERTFTIYALPTVTLTLTDDAACVSEGAFNLGGGAPLGGTYSGTGVGVSPSFNPATAGVGAHTITYTYTDGNSCTNTATDGMTVNALPVVTLTLTDDAACVSESAFNLGGGAPLGGTYSGTGVGVSPSFNPATAGVGAHTITYTYTDGNGCTNTATDGMTVNALPVVTLTLTDDAACVSESAFNLGGGAPLGGTYSGTGVGVSPSFNPATAGVGAHTITYTYTDGNGCTSTATDGMTVNALPVVTLTLTDDAACVSESAFNLGGGSPLGGTYSGTGVGVSPSFNPAAAGVGAHTITYTYTDGNGCTSTAIDGMTVNALPVVTLTLTDDAACVSESAFNLGGGAPLGGTYSGTGVGVSPSFNPATAGVGTHTITYTYTDGNGCTSTATDGMTVNALPVVTLTLTDDAACVSESAFNLGGGAPLGGTYSGTGVGVSPSFNPATAGVGAHTITYTYTDGNGCTNTATDGMTVNALPVVTLTLTDDAACVSESAFNLGGGSPLGGTYSGTGVGVSPSFNPATAGVGSHTITYTYTDGNGCTNTATDGMTVNALPVVTLTLTDDAACVSESAFNLGGGVPLGGTYSGTGVGVSPSFNPATAGVGAHTITYTYTDGNGCTNTATDGMTVNALPVVTLTLTDDAACVSEGAFNLGGGAPLGGTYSGTGVGVSPSFNPATAGVGAHTITYTYTDGNSCTNTATDGMTVNALPVVTLTLTDDAACVSESAFNLGGGSPLGGTYSGTGVGVSPSFNPGTAGVGTYTITYTYTDVNGCTSSATDAITVNPNPDIAIPDTTICAGDVAGVFDAGAGFSAYAWSVNGTGNAQTTARTSAGLYSVIVTDANGCKDTTSATLFINSKPDISVADTTICAGDVAGVFDAGAGFTTYNWSVNGTGTSQTTARTTAGVYTVSVIDANGCKDTTSATLFINAKPDISVADTTICAGDVAGVFDAGAGFTSYAWSVNGTGTSQTTARTTAGVYTVNVVDANGCKDTTSATLFINAKPNITVADTTICAGDVAGVFNAGAGFTSYAWSVNGTGTSQTTARTTAGVYTVSVIDANGCKDTTSATLFINSKPDISVADTTICAGDVAGVFDAGAGFTSYTWSVNGTGTSQTTPRTVAGVYTVRVVDANGCKDTTSATLFINAKPDISVADTTICAGDAAGVFDAGSGFTSYEWTVNGIGTSQTTARTVAGVYTVSVIDANGCKDTTSATLFINSKPDISVADTTICAGDVAGVFDAGAGFTSYTWSVNGTGTSQTTARTTAGVYTVNVVDANGCKDTTSATLFINAKPSISIADTTICAGDVAGVFDAGAGFTTYNWSVNGTGTSQTTPRTIAGVYTVSVIDANGCKDTTSATLFINAKPDISVADTTICAGDVAGVFNAGAGFTSYEWTVNGTGTSQTTPRTTAGVYTVSVIDANGCKDTTSATLVVNLKPVAVITAINDVCVNATGTLNLVASPANGSWKYDGNANSGYLNLGAMAAGSHDITYYYSDNNACKDTAETSFEVFDTNQVNLPATAAYCQGTSYTYTIPNLWTTIKWNNVLGGTSYTVSNGTQAVSVVVTDANGCSTQDISAVTENPYPTPDLGNDIELCAGESATLDPGTASNLSYSWSPVSATSPTLIVSSSATYKVVVTDGIGCSGADSIVVVVHELPEVTLGADTSICDNGFDRIMLHAAYSGPMQVLWSTYEKNVDSIKIGMVGDYWIQVTDSNSCVNKDIITVVHKCPDYFFNWPNVFTPNGDGFNDEFIPKDITDENFMQVIANMKKLEFEVYNRWGVKVFESTNVIPRWDGRFNGEEAPAGTYYWLVKYTNSAEKSYEDKGFVQLIR
jgi:gliding motility-associated-like protein